MVADIVSAAVVAFGVIFLAELGDKTQLLALGFGARHSLRHVALGLFIGYGLASVVAVAAGGLLGATFPERPVAILSGTVFLVFGLLALRGSDISSDEPELGRQIMKSSVTAAIALSILIAEMGDKTQIATATLASRSSALGTWIGATLGEVSSGMVGAVAGTLVGDRIPAQMVRILSAALFIAFGAFMIIGGFQDG